MTKCASCGAWFVWPPPSAAAVLEHYGKNEAGLPGKLREWRSGTNQTEWYELLARRMARRTLNTEISSVVDVGAGALELTASLARAFGRARVEAWDLFASGTPCADSDRITFRNLDLNQMDTELVPNERFDVVACVAVIEHVLDPAALLRLLHSITAPGGFAYIVGPDVTSFAHHLMRKSWPYYCPDEHLTLPSFSSIEKALAIVGGGRHELRRVNVHYSLKYLMRYLHLPIPIPAAADFLLPVPAGAFELVWEKHRT